MDYLPRAFASPGRYIQGNGLLKNVHHYVSAFGKKFFLIASAGRLAMHKAALQKSFADGGADLVSFVFGGEATIDECERLSELCKSEGCDCILGLGGGKVLDTAKQVAAETANPCICIPTTASTDAPTSSLSILYTAEGEVTHVSHHPRNPDLVLVDSGVIASAGCRLLAAGIGDAFSTYYEARVCAQAYLANLVGGTATRASMALAELCRDILFDRSVPAYLAVRDGVVVPAVEDIIEANTLLSGIGFESNGTCTAHAVYVGFSSLRNRKHLLHGEYVAFGTLVQCILENYPLDEWERLVRVFQQISLPICFSQLISPEEQPLSEEEIRAACRRALQPEESIHNEPFAVSAESLYAAMLTADRLGRTYLKTHPLSAQ